DMWESIYKVLNIKFFHILIVLTGYQVSLSGQPAGLYINEFMASNVSYRLSPYYEEFADWLEIYNAGPSEVNLRGYYLTDDPSDSAKFRINTDTTLAAGEYMIFWADENANFVHTSFKLRRSGEFIGLYDTGGNVVDSLSYGLQESDVSFGRKLDDLETWVFYAIPTPGFPNHNEFQTGKASVPQFSLHGGYYSGSQAISLYSDSPSAEIYYSFDGTQPNKEDSLYTSPIPLDTTSALRARAFEIGKLPSDIVTHTYLIDEDVHLPVIAIATDPMNFFDDSLGIYVIGTNGRPGYCSDIPHNTNMDWERPVNVEFYDTDGNVEINQRAGIKIFGGCSRTRYPHKSLALYARGEYGKGSFDVQLFDQKPIYEFESFILRASGDDCRSTLFRDALGQAVIVDRTDIDWQAYRPAVVYLNGQYWGIYNIREKLNEHYPAGNYNIDPGDVNMVRGSRGTGVMHGSSDDYVAMMEYIENQDLSSNNVYQYAASRININNYIDYQIAEIYYAQSDWPRGNIKFWRASEGKYDRWRWIMYDLDGCLHSYRSEHNTIELATEPNCHCTWPNPPYATLLFRKMLENKDFRNEFIQRYAWHMNTTFRAARIVHFIDSMQANIAPEIPRHIKRWGGTIVPYPESWIRPIFDSVEEWEGYVDNMRNFAYERQDHAKRHIRDHFYLQNGMMLLTVSSAQPEAGMVKLNNQEIEEDLHQGEYFKNVPLKLRAMSHIGYKFSHWDYKEEGKSAQIIKSSELLVDTYKNLAATAYFELTNDDEPYVIINEINYNSHEDFNPGDWIELYNNRDEPVDLSGWTLKDDNDDHIFRFPKGLDIGPHKYLVICEDIVAFRELFPEVKDPIGGMDFGLGNGGDAIRIYTSEGTLWDIVNYEDEEPWPVPPDGEGPTLELINPGYDNQMPESWVVSIRHGTPGQQNQMNSIDENVLGQNYPNPLSNGTIIPYQIFTPGFVVIKVFDSMGRMVKTLVTENQETAFYEVYLDADNLKTGIYYYTMVVDNVFADTKRMIIIK
ncbi:CotH kinase family protein, partial [Bacteroidota bacterium]